MASLYLPMNCQSPEGGYRMGPISKDRPRPLRAPDTLQSASIDLNFCHEAFEPNRVSEYRVVEFRFVDNGNVPKALLEDLAEQARTQSDAAGEEGSGTRGTAAAGGTNSTFAGTAGTPQTQAQYSQKLLDSATRRLLEKTSKKNKYARTVKGKTNYEQKSRIEGRVLFKTAAVVFKSAESFDMFREKFDLHYTWTDNFDPDVCLQDEMHKDFLACQSRFVDV
eukprot:g13738.t1